MESETFHLHFIKNLELKLTEFINSLFHSIDSFSILDETDFKWNNVDE